jgi:hypothetical protein
MSEDPRQAAAEAIYNGLLNAQRDDGDGALCDALDKLAEGTGQNKFRHAASVLRGTVLGRSAIDDVAALRRITAYPAAQRREAVGIVARQIAGSDATEKQIDAIAHRLRRKLRQIENEADRLLKSVVAIR